jgi:hypothetical protein
MLQLSATRCSCIATLLVGIVSFAAITLCVASQRVFIVVHFVIDSVRKLLDTLSHFTIALFATLNVRLASCSFIIDAANSIVTRIVVLHISR